MKQKAALIGAILSALAMTAAHADQTVELPGPLPSVEVCESAWAGAETPETAAAVFIAALIAFETDEDMARDCMRRIVDDGYLSNGQLSYDFNYLIEVGIERSPEIARSYVAGAEPANGYALPEAPWPVVFTRDARFDLGDGRYRVKVITSGQPTPRPVTMRLDDAGHYRVHEASTLFVGVAAPQ